MSRFITLTGVNANHLSTPNINKLDSNDSHIYQSKGNWVIGAGSNSVAKGTPPVAPPYGTTALQVDCKAASADSFSLIAGLGSAYTQGSNESFSIYYYTDAANREGVLHLGGTTGSRVPLVAGEWTRVTVSRAGAQSSNNFFAYLWGAGEAIVESEDVWLAAAQWENGSVSPFLPSMQIDGDAHLRARVRSDDYSTGSEQYLLSTRSGNSGYMFSLGTTGSLAARHGTSADARLAVTSSTPLTDGSAHTIEVAYDISAGTADHIVDVAVIETDTGLATAAADPTGSTLYVGSTTGGTSVFNGGLIWVEVLDGIDGLLVAKMSAADAAQTYGTTLSDSDTWVGLEDGRTWTVTATADLTIGSSGLSLPSIHPALGAW